MRTPQNYDYSIHAALSQCTGSDGDELDQPIRSANDLGEPDLLGPPVDDECDVNRFLDDLFRGLIDPNKEE